jgi:Fur family transcriptional regulator, peroxide stress response regulator
MKDAQEKSGQRYSRQREEILRIVLATESHPTADWVYEQARQIVPNISLGTVYRNLSLLVDERKINRLVTDDGVVRYDGNAKEHHHFICTKTGKIIDIEEPMAENILDEFQKKTGLKARGYKIEFYGESE